MLSIPLFLVLTCVHVYKIGKRSRHQTEDTLILVDLQLDAQNSHSFNP